MARAAGAGLVSRASESGEPLPGARSTWVFRQDGGLAIALSCGIHLARRNEQPGTLASSLRSKKYFSLGSRGLRRIPGLHGIGAGEHRTV